MTSPKVVNIQSAQRKLRTNAPRTMDEIAEKARLEYERLKRISAAEPENFASGDVSNMDEDPDEDDHQA